MTSGSRVIAATGAMSRKKLNLSSSLREAFIAFAGPTIKSVYPSAGARTTASVAMLPEAPGLFSTMTLVDLAARKAIAP